MSELPVFFVAVVDKLLQGNMSGRTGKRMLILVAGAIMAKGRRTVASVLSVMGLSETMRGCDLKFGKYASLAYLGLSARLCELNSSANPWQKLTLNKFCRFWRGTERT